VPIKYTLPVVRQPARTAAELHCEGIKITTPVGGDTVVEFTYVELDADGMEVIPDRTVITLLGEDLEDKYEDDFKTVYGILKKVVYAEALEAKDAATHKALFAAGHVV
jgi:hypothetical protein